MVRQARPLDHRTGRAFRRPVTPPRPATARPLVGTLVVLAWLVLAAALRSM